MMTSKHELNAQQLRKVDATLSITMSIEDWQQLANVLPERWPCTDLEKVIVAMIESAQRSLTKP